MISMNIFLWLKLGFLLRSQGQGMRESGAFLLAKRDKNKVVDFMTYLELDPKAYDSGIIDFDGAGMVRLSEYCSKNELMVIADIHTHPGRNTSQSSLDKEYPMIKISGHVALIAPNYFKNPFLLLNGLGVYLYKGDGNWKILTKTKSFKLKVI